MTQRATVMLIDDSREDAELFAELIDMAGREVGLIHCAGGTKALTALFSADGGTAERPDLIFLDLNMPGVDGREVLTRLKADSATRKIPVIILTTSDNPADVDFCYEAGANSFFVKPVDLQTYFSAFETMMKYWLGVARLPGH
ncbi:response regulator [Acuticoccus yangtzensis]|uniref:response regulator n=1 Tax=Acuticoccus yangtzensis TaxID=1443441 RepID=UPI00094992A9|nr:response regulator [Acuticoccus yangtzensis]